MSKEQPEAMTRLAVYHYTIIYQFYSDGVDHTWECNATSAEEALERFDNEHQQLPDHELMGVSRGAKVGEWQFVPVDKSAPVPTKTTSRNVVPPAT